MRITVGTVIGHAAILLLALKDRGIGNHKPLSWTVQKTVTFHINFEPETIETLRYENQAQYSWEDLRLANKALGRSN